MRVEHRRLGILPHARRAHLVNARAEGVCPVDGLHPFDAGRLEHLRGVVRHVHAHGLLVVANLTIEAEHGKAPLVALRRVEVHAVVVMRENLAEPREADLPWPGLGERGLERFAHSELRDSAAPGYRGVKTTLLGREPSVTRIIGAGGRESTPAATDRAFATLRYEDDSGLQTYAVTQEHTSIGRGGSDLWVDVPLETSDEVSREHLGSAYVQMIVNIGNLIVQRIQFPRQALDFRFRSPVHVVIQFAAQPVLRILPVLAHHNHWCLDRRQHR